MPRRLPWQQASPPSMTVREPKRRGSPLATHRAYERDGDGNDIEGSTTPPGRSQTKAREREPSSSPPPPAGPPPQTEFMREGLTGDDRWIMVEDEFMITAREFTQHIHQAEYNRLKQLAKTRNVPAISSITLPTNRPGLSKVAKIRRRSEVIARKQKHVLEPFASDEDSDDDPWSQHPHLAGLIGQPRTSTSSLSQLVGNGSNTRASLGYSQSQSKDEVNAYRIAASESADKELGSMSLPRRSNHATSIHTTSTATNGLVNRAGRSGGVWHSRALALSDVKEHPSEAASLSDASTLDVVGIKSENAASTSISSSSAERMARRRADTAKREKRGEKSVSLDQVPTFLF